MSPAGSKKNIWGCSKMRKTVIFIADSLDNAHKFQAVLHNLDVEVAAGSSLTLPAMLRKHPTCDLVIYEVRDDVSATMGRIESLLLEDNIASLLVIVNDHGLNELRLPVQIKSDFVVNGASNEECTARIRQLLWPGTEGSAVDNICVDDMVINLATYQVTVGGQPLDFTYLEYALLAFLATHPGRTYSRDALLRRVWGFDYYGGSRTVDVHVRRVRAKLGPDLAQHLETVRGVGYLWSV